MLRFLSRLRRRFSQAPVAVPALDPKTSQVERVRGMVSAKPAAAWTEETKKHNQAVENEWQAERQERYDALASGARPHPPGVQHYVDDFRAKGKSDADALIAALWMVVDYEMWKESCTANVTHEKPKFEKIGTAELDDVEAMKRTQRQIQQHDTARVEALRPTADEILEAAGGNPERAKQLQAKVDEVFGVAQ